MDKINLQISIDEANLILEALGNLPFVKVYALIDKVQKQAGQQLGANGMPEQAAEEESPAPLIKE